MADNWIKNFKNEKKRAPRILHIGNIANNAYNNAKLLNEAGLDCDVICYDYYHIMGCPEWEDADFESDIKDHFYPVWNKVDLKGFKRPSWFAQGPLKICILYLTAKRKNQKLKAQFLWWWMEIFKSNYCAISSKAKLDKTTQRLRIELIPFKLRDFYKKFEYYLRLIFYDLLIYFFSVLKIHILFILITLQEKYNHRFPKLKIETKNLREKYNQRFIKKSPITVIKEPNYVKELSIKFGEAFPDRNDQLKMDDLNAYLQIIPFWQKLFQHYDVIQAYSTDGIIPLLAMKRPYCCLEHGTLREIPFKADAQGRRTAISYHLADHVFVTNSDCLKNARLLSNGKVSFINHPYDEDHGLKQKGWQELRKELCNKLKADFLFFFPTRQDWIPDTGYSDKANDVFLRSFAKLRNDGHRVGMICCSWGANVEESKKLLKENGCSYHVLWKEPMGTVMFERTALACHVVVDQFKLGSFGGILFKAMAIGKAVCTYLNENDILNQYSEMPPVINCRNEIEIVEKMKEIMENPSILEKIGSSSRKWIKKYYNSSDTVRIQLKAYEKILGKSNISKKND